MNKIILLATAALLATACASPPSLNPALASCPSQWGWFCSGNSQAPTINVNTSGKKLKARPHCVKAVEGSQLVFRITPINSEVLNTVEIVPKDPSHTWLSGRNSVDRNLIIVSVPNGLDPAEKYYYGIKTNTRCVDPRVHVEY